MKKIFAALSLLCLITLAAPLTAHAHELKESNGVTTLLHVEPYEDPRVNVPAELDFTFKQASNQPLKAADYTLRLLITKDGQPLSRLVLTPNTTGIANTTFVFPSAGTYQIAVNGEAINPAKPNFAMTFRLEATTKPAPKNTATTAIIVGGVLIVTVIALAAWYLRPQEPAPKSKIKSKSE